MAYGKSTIVAARLTTEEATQALAEAGGFADGAIYIREDGSGESQLWVYTKDGGSQRLDFVPQFYKCTYQPASALNISSWADNSSQTVTICPDLDYEANDRIEISYDHDNYWIARVTAYNSTTGSITFTITEGVGTGTNLSIFTFDQYNPVVRNENVLAVKAVHANYNALAAQTRFTPADGDLALVTASQGTRWALTQYVTGGTFYPAGLYTYDASDSRWEFLSEDLAEGIYEAVQNQRPTVVLSSTAQDVTQGALAVNTTTGDVYMNISNQTITGVTTNSSFTGAGMWAAFPSGGSNVRVNGGSNLGDVDFRSTTGNGAITIAADNNNPNRITATIGIGGVDSTSIASGAVTAAKLGANAVTPTALDKPTSESNTSPLTVDNGGISQDTGGRFRLSPAFTNSAGVLALEMGYSLTDQASDLTGNSNAGVNGQFFMSTNSSATDVSTLISNDDPSSWGAVRSIVMSRSSNDGPPRSIAGLLTLIDVGSILEVRENTANADGTTDFAVWTVTGVTFVGGDSNQASHSIIFRVQESLATITGNNNLDDYGQSPLVGLRESHGSPTLTDGTSYSIVIHGSDRMKNGEFILNNSLNYDKLNLGSTTPTNGQFVTYNTSTGGFGVSDGASNVSRSDVEGAVGSTKALRTEKTFDYYATNDFSIVAGDIQLRTSGGGVIAASGAYSGLGIVYLHPRTSDTDLIAALAEAESGSQVVIRNTGGGLWDNYISFIATGINSNAQSVSGLYSITTNSSNIIDSNGTLPSSFSGNDLDIIIIPALTTEEFTHGATILPNTIDLTAIDATGTPSSSTYLRGDGRWTTVTGGSADYAGAIVELSSTGQSVASHQIARVSSNEWYVNVSGSAITGVTLTTDFSNESNWLRLGDLPSKTDLTELGVNPDNLDYISTWRTSASSAPTSAANYWIQTDNGVNSLANGATFNTTGIGITVHATSDNSEDYSTIFAGLHNVPVNVLVLQGANGFAMGNRQAQWDGTNNRLRINMAPGDAPSWSNGTFDSSALVTVKIQRVADNFVFGSSIVNGTITGPNIADDSIGADQVDDAEVVTIAGTQTISGTKSFSGDTTLESDVTIGSAGTEVGGRNNSHTITPNGVIAQTGLHFQNGHDLTDASLEHLFNEAQTAGFSPPTNAPVAALNTGSITWANTFNPASNNQWSLQGPTSPPANWDEWIGSADLQLDFPNEVNTGVVDFYNSTNNTRMLWVRISATNYAMFEFHNFNIAERDGDALYLNFTASHVRLLESMGDPPSSSTNVTFYLNCTSSGAAIDMDAFGRVRSNQTRTQYGYRNLPVQFGRYLTVKNATTFANVVSLQSDDFLTSYTGKVRTDILDSPVYFVQKNIVNASTGAVTTTYGDWNGTTTYANIAAIEAAITFSSTIPS